MLFPTVLAAAISNFNINPTWTPGCLCTPSDKHFDSLAYPGQVPKCTRSVSASQKAQVAKPYGVPKSDWPNYEFDHFIPLAIGGSNDQDNIWPQAEAGGSLDKDKIENAAYQQLKKGQITQKEAVQMILDWTNNAYGTDYDIDQVMTRECTGTNH
ncbi:hypothetical protein EDD86DRAFT_131674 [Gorgonomyces haynaldii]|nr:hypothetical protein EDD86DRAFT_131674 [Gorgonomyces haynaldii]